MTTKSPYVIDLPQRKRRVGDGDIPYDEMCENGYTREPLVMDIDDCKLSIERWQAFAHRSLSYRAKLVAARRIAKALIRYSELIKPPAKVAVKIPKAKRVQVPTNKPDGISRFPNPDIIAALKREFISVGKCNVMRGNKVTPRVYDIVEEKSDLYILRCPVTGGTFGRRATDIKLLEVVS